MIKVNKEMIDKMPQLDRIELRQRHYELERGYGDSLRNTNCSVENSFLIWMFCFVTDIWCALHGKGWFSYDVYHNILIVTIFYILLSIFLDIFNRVVYSKKAKMLYGDYFKEEVKLRRKK